MKLRFLLAIACISIEAFSQEIKESSIFDGRHWGIVIEHPEMNKVVVKQDVVYLSDDKSTLKMDVYLPPGIGPDERRPAIVFLNAIGETPGEPKVKSWGTYRTWPQFVAANGYVGISMETDGKRVQESLAGLFAFIEGKGNAYHIDSDKLGVYTASANVYPSLVYLMKPDAYRGIKAAVCYYGRQVEGPYRKDLPVLFVVPEGDARGDGYATLWNEVLKNNAPWTIQMGSGLIHAFDTFNDTNDSRKIIKETMFFWKNNLDPMVAPSWPNSIGRETLAAQYGHDPDKASTLLKGWLTDHPDDARALFLYGNVLKNLKRYAEAEGPLKKVMVLDPKNIYAKADLVSVQYGLNKTADAEKLLSKMIQSGSMNRNTYASLGFSLYVLNKHREGVPLYEKAIELDPNNAWDYYNLACGYAILHEREKAFSALIKSVDMGMNSREQIVNDPDLESLRTDQRYKDLLARMK